MGHLIKRTVRLYQLLLPSDGAGSTTSSTTSSNSGSQRFTRMVEQNITHIKTYLIQQKQERYETIMEQQTNADARPTTSTTLSVTTDKKTTTTTTTKVKYASMMLQQFIKRMRVPIGKWSSLLPVVGSATAAATRTMSTTPGRSLPPPPCMKNTKQSSVRATVVVWILRRRYHRLLWTIIPHMTDLRRSSTRRCARPRRLDICNSNSTIPPHKQRTYKVPMPPNNFDEQQTTTKPRKTHPHTNLKYIYTRKIVHIIS